MMADGVLQQLSICDIVGAVDDCISLFTIGTVISFFGGLIGGHGRSGITRVCRASNDGVVRHGVCSSISG